MSLRKRQILSALFIGVGLILAIFRWGTWLSNLGFALIVLGLILDVALVRCPKCGVWLGKYPGEYCSACGEKLNWKGKKRER